MLCPARILGAVLVIHRLSSRANLGRVSAGFCLFSVGARYIVPGDVSWRDEIHLAGLHGVAGSRSAGLWPAILRGVGKFKTAGGDAGATKPLRAGDRVPFVGAQHAVPGKDPWRDVAHPPRACLPSS